MDGITKSTKTFLILGIIGVAGYYFYNQFSLLTQSIISVEGINKLAIQQGSLVIQPDLGIYNPSDISISVNNLAIKAYTKQGSQWVLSGITPVPLTKTIGAKQQTFISPTIQVPLASIAIQAISSALYSQTKMPLVKLEISASVANKPVNMDYILDPNEYTT